VVTGIGVVSPIGIGKSSFWQGLKSGRSGVGKITHFDASNLPVKIAAEVKNFKPDPPHRSFYSIWNICFQDGC